MASKLGQVPSEEPSGFTSVPVAVWRRRCLGRTLTPVIPGVQGNKRRSRGPFPHLSKGEFHCNGMTGAPEEMRRLEHEPLSRYVSFPSRAIPNHPGGNTARDVEFTNQSIKTFFHPRRHFPTAGASIPATNKFRTPRLKKFHRVRNSTTYMEAPPTFVMSSNHSAPSSVRPRRQEQLSRHNSNIL